MATALKLVVPYMNLLGHKSNPNIKEEASYLTFVPFSKAKPERLLSLKPSHNPITLIPPLVSVSLGCARPTGVQHGYLLNQTEANRGSFPPGTLLTYVCEPGYTANSPTSIICTSTGTWSHQPPHCIRSNGEQGSNIKQKKTIHTRDKTPKENS